MEHPQTLELIPLYALGALEDHEAAELSAHLETCPTCREELDANLEVAASFTADAPAPAALWARIEAEIDQDSSRNNVVDISTARRSAPWAKWVLGAAAAGALVLAGVLVGQNRGFADLTDQGAIIAASQAAANQSDSLVADFLVDGEAVAQVVVSADGTGYLIPNDNLASLDPDRTYQLWVITPDELVISAGVIGSEPRPAVFTWNDEIAGFALTREVAGGVVSSAGDVVSVISEV